MEHKDEFDKMLVSYLMKELNTEEEAYVVKTINADKELKAYFEELDNLWNLLTIEQNTDGINIEEELKRFKEKQKANKSAPVVEQQNLYVVQEDEESKKGKIYWLMRSIAIAASVLILVGIGRSFVQFKKEKEPSVASEKKVEKVKDAFFARVEKNVSGKTKLILLEDGTEVLLFDQSELSFTEPFATDKRDISLKGKASFKVAKDKTRPFTVFSGDITTTALGTEFVVTNFENEQMITVRLLEGKVVVKSVDSLKIKLKNPFYLLPGQELLYNRRTATARVRSFQKEISKESPQYKKESPADNPSLPKNYGGSWYMFNNRSLPDIFDQLESMFGVEIVYTKKDVEKFYFIGTFNKSDSLEYILKNITSINKLTLSKENNRYIIRK